MFKVYRQKDNVKFQSEFIRTPYRRCSGFTLVESLVAITVLTVAIAAPLTLASQSLSSAYTARDQVIAFNLAQDAIETVRAQRDNNILDILKNGATISWLNNLDVQLVGDAPKPFMVDSLSLTDNFLPCSSSESSSCDNLLFDADTGFYGHEQGRTSKFKRYVTIKEVPNTNGEEVKVGVVVEWNSGLSSTRKILLEENMYNWPAGITTQ